jgi:hypothetical protein
MLVGVPQLVELRQRVLVGCRPLPRLAVIDHRGVLRKHVDQPLVVLDAPLQRDREGLPVWLLAMCDDKLPDEVVERRPKLMDDIAEQQAHLDQQASTALPIVIDVEDERMLPSKLVEVVESPLSPVDAREAA